MKRNTVIRHPQVPIPSANASDEDIMRTVLTLVALCVAQPTFAQTADPRSSPAVKRPTETREQGWSMIIGIAPVLSPVWQGSRDQALSIFPDLRLNYKDAIFASIPDGLG
ncbi:hypothetical protein [Blastomonas fulva]|uniref:hypothetical protein n=1 Tax=Blastomonas fulva TaxID=1550728 RepID=UPI003F71F953